MQWGLDFSKLRAAQLFQGVFIACFCYPSCDTLYDVPDKGQTGVCSAAGWKWTRSSRMVSAKRSSERSSAVLCWRDAGSGDFLIAGGANGRALSWFGTVDPHVAGGLAGAKWVIELWVCLACGSDFGMGALGHHLPLGRSEARRLFSAHWKLHALSALGKKLIIAMLLINSLLTKLCL